MNIDEMTWEEIDKWIEETPHGKNRMEVCRKAWEKADKYEYYKGQMDYRFQYMSESAFYDDNLEMYVVFPAILKLHDKHVKEYGYDDKTETVVWRYKWLLGDAAEFYQISQKQFEMFSEDFKKRCIQNGYSLRSYYQKRYKFYMDIDKKMAAECYQEFSKCHRDAMSDCHACERYTEVKYLLNENDLEQALKRAEPLLRGQMTCGEEPECTYGIFLQYYNRKMKDGNMEYKASAAEMCEKLKRGIARRGVATEHIPDILMYYSIAEPSKALGYYKKNWSLFETNRNPVVKFNFAIAAMQFFNNLKEKKSYKMTLDVTFPFYNEKNTYNVEELKAYYRKAAEEIAGKFDQRNGNSHYTDMVNTYCE